MDNDLKVRDMLRAKFGNTQIAGVQRKEVASYEEAREAGNVKDMLRAKVFANEARYNNTQLEIEKLSISKVVINKKALEKRLDGLEKEQGKKLEEAEHNLASIYEKKVKEARDGLAKSYLRKEYLDLLAQKQNEIDKTTGQRIREYKIDLQAYEDREIQFEKENEVMIKELAEENKKKQVKEYLSVKEI